MMTLNDKNLVMRSFAQVMPIAETAAELFYGRLFELDPTLRPMFRGDMREQGRKLMQMLAVAVHGCTVGWWSPRTRWPIQSRE